MLIHLINYNTLASRKKAIIEPRLPKPPTPVPARVEDSRNLINKALLVLDTGIKNGRETIETIKRSPITSLNVHRALLKNEEAAKNALRLRGKISRLKMALEDGDEIKVFQELCGNIFNKLESVSHELMLHLAEMIFVVYLDNIEESYRRAEEDISDIMKSGNDEVSKSILRNLIERNQTVGYNCIFNMIPKIFNHLCYKGY